MKRIRLNWIIVLGLMAIVGILVAQLLWTRQAYNLEEVKFNERTHIALLEVVKKLYEGTNSELPTENPVHKIANDYYVVNVSNDFEPKILEFYLRSEFAKASINTDFEYAVYNCQSDEMVYGNYVAVTASGEKHGSVYFPKHKNLVYYFAIRFPKETSYLFTSLRFWFVLSFALVVILVVYVYSIFTIIQQRKYSDLQRDFINNMTHEFKTPLSSILLAAQYLARQDKIKEDQKLEKYADIIIGQGNKLNRHVEKILSIAKSDEVPLQLQKTTVNLKNLIAEVTDHFCIKHENISIENHIAMDYTIEADDFHLTNVLYNLLDNAAKYSVDTPQVRISAKESGKQLMLLIADEGVGIPEKKITHIFDKFYRVQNEKSNETNGFGLGLYYVRKIADLHHWKIKAANNETTGITVTLTFPDHGQT